MERGILDRQLKLKQTLPHTHTAKCVSNGGCGCFAKDNGTNQIPFSENNNPPLRRVGRVAGMRPLVMEFTEQSQRTSTAQARPQQGEITGIDFLQFREYNSDPKVADFESGEACWREWVNDFR